MTATPARAFLVSRRDPPGGAYYLVVLGDPSAALGIAAVDAASGEVTQWATLPDAAPHPLLDREAAIQRTGASSARRAELVWRSSRLVASHLCIRSGRSTPATRSSTSITLEESGRRSSRVRAAVELGGGRQVSDFSRTPVNPSRPWTIRGHGLLSDTRMPSARSTPLPQRDGVSPGRQRRRRRRRATIRTLPLVPRSARTADCR